MADPAAKPRRAPGPGASRALAATLRRHLITVTGSGPISPSLSDAIRALIDTGRRSEQG